MTHVGSIGLTWDDLQDEIITKHQYQLKVNDETPDAWEDIPDSGLLILQSHILVEMSESTLVVAVAGPGLVAPPPTGPGQHSLR